uniref:Prostate and testis expressed 10 n=1 Tax=Peromyscus maniculatus bairdii TaxID=230844 RepID=A0A8C8VUP2_PERMB
MDWLLFLLLPGVLLVLCESHLMGENTLCSSCDEYFDKTCRKNMGVCRPRYPDLACQTKEVYFQTPTGGEAKAREGEGWEYVHFVKMEKNIFSCCNESYCNSFPEKKITSSKKIIK